MSLKVLCHKCDELSENADLYWVFCPFCGNQFAEYGPFVTELSELRKKAENWYTSRIFVLCVIVIFISSIPTFIRFYSKDNIPIIITDNLSYFYIILLLLLLGLTLFLNHFKKKKFSGYYNQNKSFGSPEELRKSVSLEK